MLTQKAKQNIKHYDGPVCVCGRHRYLQAESRALEQTNIYRDYAR